MTLPTHVLHFGTTILSSGTFNITKKMTWDLRNAKVELHGTLSFAPDIEYWLDAANTYRVVFIQNQASWFVVTGKNFVIDAHGEGGINGNGQPWWSFFATRTREDGDGRPISFTVWRARNATIKNFHVESPPFWCNTVAESQGIVYDPNFVGKNIVPNTDGINIYRSSDVSLLNWDITCGDDCLAIKGNSTELTIRNITCFGGNGIAFGSLGQYADMSDNVANVSMEDLKLIRINSSVQPNMNNGVYFKSWTGAVNGVPPTGGGGGSGLVKNISITNVQLDRVNAPIHLYQTNGGHSGDAPSQLMFGGLHFKNWSGTSLSNKLVDIECSSAVGCEDITFEDFDVPAPSGQAPRLICQNVHDLEGLKVCNATGLP
ncbi:hypothetical protein ONZ45_g19460 [Pleurotus djamor]|nr:hypothetical protein ONZ45_g19460 [Pleurotus djamor]